MSKIVKKDVANSSSEYEDSYPIGIGSINITSNKFFGITIKGNERFLYTKRFFIAYAIFCSRLEYPPNRTMFRNGRIDICWYTCKDCRIKNKDDVKLLYDIVLNYSKNIECLDCYGDFDKWFEEHLYWKKADKWTYDYYRNIFGESKIIISERKLRQIGMKYFTDVHCTFDIMTGRYGKHYINLRSYEEVIKYIKCDKLKPIKRLK